MTYEPFVTESAKLDVAKAALHIAEELRNPEAANKLLDAVEDAIASLEKMPKRNPLASDEHLAHLGFGFVPVDKYLVFYIVREDTKMVTIERFLHEKRDWAYLIRRGI